MFTRLIFQAKLIEWCSRENIDILLSTGGTGVGPRDVTPEATLGVIEIQTPGINQAIMYESLKITPMAMLSRYSVKCINNIQSGLMNVSVWESTNFIFKLF